jgi:hypothetical protein
VSGHETLEMFEEETGVVPLSLQLGYLLILLQHQLPGSVQLLGHGNSRLLLEVGFACATRLCAALTRLLRRGADPHWLQCLSSILGQYPVRTPVSGSGSGSRILMTNKNKKNLQRKNLNFVDPKLQFTYP